MSKIVKITSTQVAFNKLIKNQERENFLGKEVKAYYNGTSYNVFTVEDTAVDTSLKAGVILHRKLKDGSDERVPGLLFKGGFAIVVRGDQKYDVGYEDFLSSMEEKPRAFKAGIEVKISPELATQIKDVILALKSKSEGFSALMGKKKFFGSKEQKEKTSVINTSNLDRLESEGLTLKVDEKFAMVVVKMLEATGAEMFRIAAGIVSLLDLSGFKAKLKGLEQEANKREEELSK